MSKEICKNLPALPAALVIARRLMLIHFFTSFVFSACASKVSIKTVSGAQTSSSSSCTSTPGTSSEEVDCAPLIVRDVNQIVVTPGKPIKITGENFRSSLAASTWGLQLTDQRSASVRVISSTEAEVTLPDDTSYGPQGLFLTQDGVSAKLTLFSDGGKTDHPVITADPAQICTSTTFYDVNGNLRQGTKGCEADIPACKEDGDHSCVASIEFPAVEKQQLSTKVVSGTTVAGVAGSVQPAPAACAIDSDKNCVASDSFPAVEKALILPQQLLTGVTIAGVTGNLVLPATADVRNLVSFGPGQTLIGSLDPGATPASCGQDGQISCVAVENFKAADMSRVQAQNIKTGVTIAGISGGVTPSPSNCAADGSTNCVAVSNYPATRLANFSSADLKSGVTVAGISGSLANCASDGATNCVAVAAYRAAATVGLDSKVLTGNTVAGISGSATQESHSNCGADGAMGCVSVASFRAAATSGLAAKVLSGQTVAGIAGNAQGESHSNCASDGATDCVAVTTFKAADMNRVQSSNIKSGITIAGVVGDLSAGPGDCSADGATACVATDTFKAADMSRVIVGNIKSGITIAGIAGDYPSATYPLPGASTTADLDSETFNAKIKASADFEYWTSAGARQTGAGDMDIQDFNIRSGVSIFNTTGVYGGQPDSPIGFSTTGPSGTQINLSWSGSASGYLLVFRAGSAVSFTPVDGTTYTTGSEGSDQIIYVGTSTSYSHTELTVGATYYYSLYAYNSSKNYSAAVTASRTTSSIDCTTLAGGTWVAVPGDSVYNTSEFCVQKYIPSGTNTSQIGVAPRVRLDQPTARSACTALGTGYHLITNPEWMTIAANIANVGSNWSGGTVGSGALNRGHSDNSPGNDLAAAADTDPCNGTGQSCSTTTWDSQRRTRTLSNGNVIWDFGGNVWQWVDLYNNQSKPTESSYWVQYSALGNGTATWPRSAFVPMSNVQSWWNDTWNSTQSIGMILPGSSGSGGALIRGGDWGNDTGAGPFAAHLGGGPTDAYTNVYSTVGFRCTWQP